MHTLSTMPVYCSILATAPASTGRSSQCISLPETTATADKQRLGDGIILEVWCVRFHRWHDLFAIEETQTFADSEVYRKGFQETAAQMDLWQTWCMRRTENPENVVRVHGGPLDKGRKRDNQGAR